MLLFFVLLFFSPQFTFFTVYQPMIMTNWSFVDQLILLYRNSIVVRWIVCAHTKSESLFFQRARCSCLPCSVVEQSTSRMSVARFSVLNLHIWLYTPQSSMLILGWKKSMLIAKQYFTKDLLLLAADAPLVCLREAWFILENLSFLPCRKVCGG